MYLKQGEDPMEDRIIAALWKGENESTSSLHRCPLRPSGMSREDCPTISGRNPDVNRDCCGVKRDTVTFSPCNSNLRRCRVCVGNGLRGEEANAVTNVAEGTCEEHEGGRVNEPTRREIWKLPIQVKRRVPDVPRSDPVEAASCGDSAEHDSSEEKPQPPIKKRKKKQLVGVVLDEKLIALVMQNIPKLRGRQIAIFRCCGLGMSNPEMAASIVTTSATIGVEFATVYKILGVKNLDRSMKRPTVAEAAKRYFASDPEYEALLAKGPLPND